MQHADDPAAVWAADVVAGFELVDDAGALLADLHGRDGAEVAAVVERQLRTTREQAENVWPNEQATPQQLRTAASWIGITRKLRTEHAAPLDEPGWARGACDKIVFIALNRVDWPAGDLSLLLRIGRAADEPPTSFLRSTLRRTPDAVLRQVRHELRGLARTECLLAAPEYRSLLARAGDPPAEADLVHNDDRFARMLDLQHHAPALTAAPGLPALLRHCLALNHPRPSDDWFDDVAPLLHAVPEAADVLRTLLERVPQIPHTPRTPDGRRRRAALAAPLDWEAAVLMLRGLLWCAATLPAPATPWLPGLLADIACSTGTGPGDSKQPRSERLANTAVAVLARRGDDAALASLLRIEGTVAKKTLLRRVHRALGEVEGSGSAAADPVR